MEESSIGELGVRAARNQALFREINERLLELGAGGDEELKRWNCECATVGCINQIEMTLADYERLRASPVRFAVTPSDEHVFPEVEVLVERHRGYWVVEKIGEAGAEAAALAEP